MNKISTILSVLGITFTALLLGMLIGYFSQEDCPDCDCSSRPVPCIDNCGDCIPEPCVCEEKDCELEIIEELQRIRRFEKVLG